MSGQNEPAGHGPLPIEGEVPGCSQPPDARQSAEAQLHTLISRFAPAHLPLIGALRERLRERLPTAHELVYEYRDFLVVSFSPNEHGYEGVLAIHASADGVKLYFGRGKELPDPERLLQGSGKQTRWIHVEGATTLDRPAVARLIEEAINHSPGPFAGAGQGAMVIRPTAAQQRSRNR